eukprot:TRINITY_DN9601_c0_g1::TRINITY_DN9601_c0_g1_i1::g.12278::m.12278 TRINITY_DN9601_c0_g1::TRINITY_DN9601_c0_g1_i1::g.12278  ORF type:complete len:176 (-),score=10.27 TRINITY_DN9601_c0_g1_i1:152-679(-)
MATDKVNPIGTDFWKERLQREENPARGARWNENWGTTGFCSSTPRNPYNRNLLPPLNFESLSKTGLTNDSPDELCTLERELEVEIERKKRLQSELNHMKALLTPRSANARNVEMKRLRGTIYNPPHVPTEPRTPRAKSKPPVYIGGRRLVDPNDQKKAYTKAFKHFTGYTCYLTN